MERRELLARIKTFPLKAATLADDMLSGDFRSMFKGQGMEFSEVRHYEMGDDIRSIDWNVSARFGTPYVKQYQEERDMTVFVILDCSRSMHTGSCELSRYEQGLLSLALIAFSAQKAGQAFGAALFDHSVEQFFHPTKGRSHIMSIIGKGLRYKPSGAGSNLGDALSRAVRFLKRRSLVIVISDFICINWEQELKDLSNRHDLITLRISDPLDKHMMNAGLLRLEDPETGIRLHAPTGFASFRSAWEDWQDERSELWSAICKRAGAAALELSTIDDALLVLSHFFRGRKSR
ncbi:MAG: DUF58 domain-containing protein [Treponema sp.]|nr:DUF58 domain-containing protein [Treponema sp.]